jgi:hypothetical protein
MNNKSLCISLIKAESEREVIEILKREEYWDDESAWEYYGGRENNWGTTGGQQDLAEAALVEKLTNSIDALLMRECLKRGWDPEDPNQAPGSVGEAAEVFFGVKRSLLSELTTKQRSKLAENIMLIATGKKKRPNYTVIDRGEGQSPSRFADTLLSLGESNKFRIPFVQGRFNMGGTGVLPFCGVHSLQLIVSKRCPDISAEETADSLVGDWGFTVVRRFEPTGTMKNSVLKYLAQDGTILHFKSRILPVLPGKYPEAYVNPLEWGTIIKLFEYQIRPQYTTLATLDLYYRLSLMLAQTPLPFRIYERRLGYSSHTPNAVVSGLTVRLEQDRSQNVESGFPAPILITIAGQKLPCRIYAFKKRDAKRRLARQEGIVFLLGGQMHGSIPSTFFKRKKVGMSYIADYLLIIVDCDSLSRAVTERLFMTSRDRLRDLQLKSAIERAIEREVSRHQGLRDLQNRRKKEAIGQMLSDSKPLRDVLQKVIKKSPSLAALLIPGTKLHNPFDLRSVQVTHTFKCETFPDYFKLVSREEKDCPINRRFRMQYETNVCNDYFIRDKYRGAFGLFMNSRLVKDYTLNLWNGAANLTANLPKGSKVGEVIVCKSQVTYEGQVEPHESEFKIHVVDAVVKKSGGPGERIKPPGQKGNEGRKTPSDLGLPEVHPVRRDGWDKHSFDKYSALRVYNNPEGGFDFFVNIDNVYILSEIKAREKESQELMREQFKAALALFGLCLLLSQKDDDDAESVLDEVAIYSKLFAPAIIPMINDLGKLLQEGAEVSE